MATAVSIASNALLRLGANPINSFDEADESGSNIDLARLAGNLWPTVRRQVLRSHPWNCALKRVLLSPDTTPPAFGAAYRFLKPGDWLRTVAVGEDTDRISWRTEGSYFLTDESALALVYLFDNDNPGTYDATLVAAMELAMAAALAYPVTKSTSLAQALADEVRGTAALARALDSDDDPPETLGDFPLYASRFGGRLG
jgi:hypothetical protein